MEAAMYFLGTCILLHALINAIRSWAWYARKQVF